MTARQKRLQTLKRNVATALKRMEDALEALEGADPEDESVDLDELRTTFDDAEADHQTAVRALERHQAVDAARRNAPVPPAEDPEEPELREDDPAGGDARVTREPRTYERGSGQSYFLDLAREQHLGDPEASQRLRRHAREIRDDVQAREQRAERALERGLEHLLAGLPDHVADELRQRGLVRRTEERALSRVDGSGGDFVPPLYLLDEYAEAARGGRPFADACRGIPLPQGTDSISVPRIATGTATGVQTADNANVVSTDMTTATVTAPVRTIAGQQDVPLQLLEQSPIAFDEIVFADLIADQDFQTESQAINGSGSSGQVLGIRNVGSINTITYTDASPTVPEFYPKVAQGLSIARSARKRPITHGWLAPRRSYWISAALDSQGRPLVAPQLVGPANALGIRDEIAADEDFELRMLVPHRMTDAIPENVGGGTNEDVVILTRMIDHILFEGGLRARVLPEVLSGGLGVRLQVYKYVAFTAARFPAATSIVTGTGLATPTF